MWVMLLVPKLTDRAAPHDECDPKGQTDAAPFLDAPTHIRTHTHSQHGKTLEVTIKLRSQEFLFVSVWKE